MKKIKGHFWLPSDPSNPSYPSNRQIKHFEAKKKIEKPCRFLKCTKNLLTPINGKSINWTTSEILRISLRGIK